MPDSAGPATSTAASCPARARRRTRPATLQAGVEAWFDDPETVETHAVELSENHQERNRLDALATA